jgi:sortase A
LAAAGLATCLGAVWQWVDKVRRVGHEQAKLDVALSERWAANGPTAGTGAGTGTNAAALAAGGVRPGPAHRLAAAASAPVAPGTPIARLHLPTLDLALVVVEGTGDAQLAKGPGRIDGTARLGEPGNTAVAAHRYPGIFWDLDRLAADDPVVVETVDSWLVYRVTRTVVVEPEDRTVLGPPRDSGSELTLVTCEPKLSEAHRLIKQAVLVRTEPRTADDDDDRPAELSARAGR